MIGRPGSGLLHAAATLAAGLVLALPAPAAVAASLQVAVQSGRLEGRNIDGVRSFKNIPYAAPPVGELRWAAPKPPASWKGLRAADRFGAPCAQLDVARMAEAKSISVDGIDLWFGAPMAANASEDCLTLNVWAPPAAKKAPVMVFIYGGGGSADMAYWDGAAFARDGVVLVNFNYRNLTMGKFGHPALTRAAGPRDPLGRYDVMDQLAALRWVRRNIAAFGGDPANVTVFGGQAGGSAVLQLLTVPAAKGLFDKAIVQSGVGWWSSASLTENEKLGAMLAAKAGLPGANASLAQLRALPPGAFPQIGHFTYDGRLMPMDPTQAFRRGRVIDVPLLIGWNDFDGSGLRQPPAEIVAATPPAVRAAYDERTPEDLGFALYTDAHEAAPSRWIAKRTAGGAPTYAYVFTHVRASQRAKVRGATHGSELPYVFDSWQRLAPGLKLSEEEQATTRRLHGCWIAFARTGRPACEGVPVWPRYTASDDRIMDLGDTPTVRQHYRQRQLDAQEAAMATTLAAQRAALERILAEGF